MPGVWARVLLVAVVAVAQRACMGALPGGGTGSGGGPGTGWGGGRAPSRGGAPGRGGTTGEGAGGMGGWSACPATATKSAPCGPNDPQSCFKTCGPDKVGTKAETCQGGVYNEMSGCTFDETRDYSCYAIPSAPNPVCPVGLTPMASQLCDVPPCSVCNSFQGLAG